MGYSSFAVALSSTNKGRENAAFCCMGPTQGVCVGNEGRRKGRRKEEKGRAVKTVPEG
jgi:hypothetical protein